MQLDIVLSILSNWLRRPALSQKARINFPQAFLEVSQPNQDDTDINESEVGGYRENVNDQLLPKLQVFYVDGVEPRLCTTAYGEKQSIDRGDIIEASEDCKGQQGRADDVDV